ncbi:MAG: VOC family protein [Dehalococcoidia bacterium]
MNPFERFSAIPYENIYHLGIVVPDIHRAMDELGQQLGTSWSELRTFPVRVTDGGGPLTEYAVQATYSREGPPYLELIGAIGNGIWGVEQAGRIHHAGAYCEDIAKEKARLEALGFVTETHGVLPDGAVGGPIYLSNRYGLRLELAAYSGRSMVWDWVHA